MEVLELTATQFIKAIRQISYQLEQRCSGVDF